MDVFLKKFFPDVYKRESSVKPSDDQYCKFDSQILTLFTSSLYLAALVSSIFASMATRKYGRRPTMMTSGLLFAAGAIVNGLAMNVPMLIIGRLLLGFGIGCANQVKLFCSSLFYFNYHYHLAIKCVYIENPEILNSQVMIFNVLYLFIQTYIYIVNVLYLFLYTVSANLSL